MSRLRHLQREGENGEGHNDKKCLALTFYLPTASSKQLTVVN